MRFRIGHRYFLLTFTPKTLIDAVRIGWHTNRCPMGEHSLVTHTEAGRIYECPCGFGIWEAF